MEKERFVANATLVEIRERDGAQKYKLDREHHGFNVLWITGWPRASNPVVGMVGKIVYKSTNSYGLDFFVRDA